MGLVVVVVGALVDITHNLCSVEPNSEAVGTNFGQGAGLNQLLTGFGM